MHSRFKTTMVISAVTVCIFAFLLSNSFGGTLDDDQKVIFDIKKVCRSSASSLEKMLPIPKEKFEIVVSANPKYGREEEWTLNDKDSLARFGIKFIKIEIHQSKVQSAYFSSNNSVLDKAGIFKDNLSKVKLSLEELVKVMEEFRVPNQDGFPIQILGNADYYQCFEYHAGH